MAIYRESALVYVETDDPACLWTGPCEIMLPADAVLPVPTLFLGARDLVGLPELDELINGTAQRVEVTLSGVSDEALRMALEESPQVPGCRVVFGRAMFDENWQLASVEWDWTGEGVKMSASGDDGPNGRVRSITLHAKSGDTTRSRAPYAYFTAADHNRDFSDDAIFSNVGQINIGTARRWGPT